MGARLTTCGKEKGEIERWEPWRGWMGVEAGWRVIGFVRERGEEKRTEWRWSSWIDGHQKSITDLNRIDGLDGVARRGREGKG